MLEAVDAKHITYRKIYNMIEERRSTESLFEGINEMEISNKDLKIFALQIKALMAELEKNMVKKSDIESIVDKMLANHGVECPVKKMNLITVENFHSHWILSNNFHKEETLVKFDKWSDRIKKNTGWLVALGIVLWNINWTAIVDAISK